MNYRAVCFDFDYTLGDSTDCIVAGFQHAMTRMGWPAPDRETVRGTIGFLLEDSYTMLTGDADPARRAQFRPLFQSVANPLQRTQCKLFPGTVDLLEGLHGQGVQMAIVSTKSSDTLEAILDYHGLRELLGLVIGGDRVARPKPDPEGLLLALDRLGVNREELLFCGDTVMDAGAAKNAGVAFAAVLNGTTPAEAFEEWPHVHISPDLWDLKRWLGV